MRTVMKAIFCLTVCLCLLVPAGATANVDDHLDAVCRITAGNSMGSGCVFYIGSDYVYVLTNNHVVTTQKVVGLDFWSTGYQSSRLEGQVLVADPSIDAAVVLVPTGVFGGRLPNAIPLGQPADAPVTGATIVSAGCPGGAWPSAWKGHVLGYTGGDVLFVPPVMGGRSGSAILDAGGTKIVGLLWGTNDEHGIAIGIEKLRSKMHEQTTTAMSSKSFQLCAAVKDQPAVRFTPAQCPNCPNGLCPLLGRRRPEPQQPPAAGPAWPSLPAPSPAPKVDLGAIENRLDRISDEVSGISSKQAPPPTPTGPDPATAQALGQIGTLATEAKKEADELGAKVDGVAKDVGEVKQVVAPLARLRDKLEADKEAGGLKGKVAGDIEQVLEGNADPKLRLVLITGAVLAAVGGLVFFIIRHHNLTSAIRQKIDADAQTNPQLAPLASFMDRLDDRLNKLATGGLPVGLPLGLPGLTAAPAAGVADLVSRLIDQRLAPPPVAAPVATPIVVPVTAPVAAPAPAAAASAPAAAAPAKPATYP
jgi:hypothetical protein